jgi:hypothetical protein
MTFKIPDNKRVIGVSASWGTLDYPVPTANGNAAVFRFHGTPAIPAPSPGINLIPTGGYTPASLAPSLAAVRGRRLTFNNLNLTNVSSIDVSMMLATPTNPLGANASTGGVFERVFGSPLDTNGPTVNAATSATYHTNRMLSARIYYKLDDEANNKISVPAAPTGTLINTAALVAYANLSPTSPLRTFSPYTIPVPVDRQKNNVTLHIFQGFTGSAFTSSNTAPWTNGTVPVTNAAGVGVSFTSGYGWAVNSINLGEDNGGVYRFDKSNRFVSSNTNTSTPPSSPDVLWASGVAAGFSMPATNTFFDSSAIIVDPKATFTKYFDDSFANTAGLHVSDKIAFTNTSITENNLGVITDLDSQYNYNSPFRGNIGYIGKTAMTTSVGLGINAHYATRFNYSNDTWQTVSIPISAIYVHTMPGARVSRSSYTLNSAAPLIPLYNTPTAGSAYFDQLYSWDQSEPVAGMDNPTELYGHSSFYGYHFKMAGIGGSAWPAPMSIAAGSDPVTATTEGPAAAANRIRGNLIRFPFANYTDLSEIADTSPTAVNYSTWSGVAATYVYGGAGQPAMAWPVWYGGGTILGYYYAVASLGTSFKFPFGATSTVTMTSTGTGLLSTYATAATNQDAAFVLSYRYHEGTSPSTVDYLPLLNGTSAYSDDIIVAGGSGQAADPSGFPAAYSGYTESGNRRVQKFPFASETFTDFGDINDASNNPLTPVYVTAARSAGSDSDAYFSVDYSVHDIPTTSVYPAIGTWFKFPYAATTTVAGKTTWTVDPVAPTSYKYFDSGINNTQSPHTSYTASAKFPFASEILSTVSEEYFGWVPLNLSPGVAGAESWPNTSFPTLIRTAFGAINQ